MSFAVLAAALVLSAAPESEDTRAPDASAQAPQVGAEQNGRPSARDVAITKETFVPAGIEDVFDFVAAEDVLPKVLTGYGLVPGVVSTSDVTGPWSQPGSNRTVHLAGGSTAHEEVTGYSRPTAFTYRVSRPTFSLHYLMVDAVGQWWFTPVEGGTRVRWTYTFHAKGPFTRWPLVLFGHTQWAGYMNVCLKNVVRHFQTPQGKAKIS